MVRCTNKVAVLHLFGVIVESWRQDVHYSRAPRRGRITVLKTQCPYTGLNHKFVLSLIFQESCKFCILFIILLREKLLDLFLCIILSVCYICF